jgi:hypothetical protein
MGVGLDQLPARLGGTSTEPWVWGDGGDVPKSEYRRKGEDGADNEGGSVGGGGGGEGDGDDDDGEAGGGATQLNVSAAEDVTMEVPAGKTCIWEYVGDWMNCVVVAIGCKSAQGRTQADVVVVVVVVDCGIDGGESVDGVVIAGRDRLLMSDVRSFCLTPVSGRSSLSFSLHRLTLSPLLSGCLSLSLSLSLWRLYTYAAIVSSPPRLLPRPPFLDTESSALTSTPP